MPVNETVVKRKSIRSYRPAGLTALEVSEICECIHHIKPLIEGIAYSIKVVDREEFGAAYGGMFMVKAPNYVVIHSRQDEGYLVNAGYIGQMLMLGLTAKGYATCWLGGAKQRSAEKAADSLPYVIAFALGRSDESFRMSEVDASRKNVEDIISGSIGCHMEAVRAGRLAPSGMNMQPVRYLGEGNRLHIFRIKSVLGLFDRMQAIDTGIALANITACEPCYKFSVEENKPLLKGCIYVATLTKEE